MRILNDELFGELTYEYGWTRPYSLKLFDQMWTVRLIIPCDEADSIEATQREAFAKFEAGKEQFLRDAEEALFNHYQEEVLTQYREQLGEFADERAPIIYGPIELRALVRPTELLVQQSFNTPARVIGLLFSCTWEPSLGVAIKFINEGIEEVGPQDIVL